MKIQFNNFIVFGAILLFSLSLALNVNAQEGVQQRFFTSQHGLKISWVNSITKSPNNVITIVHSPTFDIARYDGYTFDYTINPTEIPFIPTPGMDNKLLFIRDGDLNEFDKVNEQTRIIKRAEDSQIGQFIDMTTFQDGSIWITGEDGVAKYLVQCDTCNYQEKWIDFQVPKSYGLHHFSKPFEGENGELTLMSVSSITKHNVLAGFDGKTWQKLYTSQTDEVHYGWRGHDNSLWIIKGIQPPPPLNSNLKEWDLFHVQQGKETLIIKNRTLNRVLNDVVVEPKGDFWLATGSGLTHFSPTLWRKIGAGTDLPQHFQKIHEDLMGRLWFASGDSFFLWSNGKWESYQFNPMVFTGDICSLKNGLLIVGISETGGLALFNPVDKSCTVTFPFGNEKIRYYDQDKNGNCLIILQDLNGTSRLIRYDGEYIETLAIDLKIDGLTPGACEVTDIIQARNGDIWIVTFTDVIVYKKGIKKSFDLKQEFEWTFSTSILELENGNIWVSGSKGIIQYDGGHWSLVQSPEFETARKMIISKDSSIWVASGTGIHRLVNGSWVSNSSEEGLPNTTIFYVIEDKQGRILAATSNGAYCYYPEADTDAPETDIPSDLNSHEAIPSGELQFVFEGHDKWDYTTHDRLLFSYRFDENSWTPFESKTIVKVVGLLAGQHVFEVKAMDRNGIIDPSPAIWQFTVMRPWYKQPLIVMLLVIGICLLLLSLGLAITRHVRIERLVQSRTAELEKTKEKAESSDRLKSAFLANMSHEIRTPMNGILGFAELLKDPDLTGEDQLRFIEMIEKGGVRLLSIITDIINISKVESGQMEVTYSESNINEQIEFIYNFFKPETESKGIKFLFNVTLPFNEAIINTDTEKLYAILTNLVKNAIKYTSKGSIKFGYEKKHDHFEFFVKDTGVGILENRQEAIFERFIQADVLNKMALQGAGLGLSISKAYVEMLGGEIWVQSEIEKGSTFYFTIPLS